MENTNYLKSYIGNTVSIKFLEKIPIASFDKVTLIKLSKDFLAFKENDGTYHEAIGFNIIIYPISDNSNTQFWDKLYKKINVYLDDYIVYRNCYHLATTNGIVDIITEEGIHMLICADKILIESIS